MPSDTPAAQGTGAHAAEPRDVGRRLVQEWLDQVASARDKRAIFQPARSVLTRDSALSRRRSLPVRFDRQDARCRRSARRNSVASRRRETRACCSSKMEIVEQAGAQLGGVVENSRRVIAVRVPGGSKDRQTVARISKTRTLRPALASRQAVVRPLCPAPITMTW